MQRQILCKVFIRALCGVALIIFIIIHKIFKIILRVMIYNDDIMHKIRHYIKKERKGMNKKHALRTAAGIMSLALIMNSMGITKGSEVHAAAKSNVTINEICPKNSIYTAPDGNCYDWIELYNPTGSSVDLSGWGLTDKQATPYQFTFASGTTIGANQRLVVFCDSKAAETNTSYAPFGLSTGGETLILTDKNGTTVDTVTFGSMADDTAYGQYPDGSGEFYVLNGTPSNQNAAPEGSNAVQTPGFSAESGFYNNSFQLSISAPQGTTVYYTLDGSNPTTESEKYVSPITVNDMTANPNVYSARTDISASEVEAPTENVDKAAIVRAIAVDSQGRTSEIITKTYFIGTTNTSYYKDMKVVSLVTDPDNLFDYEKGIYVKGKVYDDNYSNTGGAAGPGGWGGGFGGGFGAFQPWAMEANYTQKGREWEREASFELFENGESVLSQNVGIRIKGAASRSTPQKSFNIYARNEYGKDVLEYDFFDGTATKAKNGKKIDKFDSITIRNGGNDNSAAFFRDSINQQLVADRDFAMQASSECLVFIDGEYWGIYQITEKVSDDFIKSHYGIDKSDVAIIKNSELEEGTDQDLNDWNNIISKCANSDMTNTANYEEFCNKVDVQSFIDYFSAQIYWCNGDWPHNNLAVWRSNVVDASNEYSDGKWRMFLFDTEYSTGLYGGTETAVSTDVFNRMSSGFNASEIGRAVASLLKNPEFKKQFALTFMDIANNNFSQENTKSIIDKFKNTYGQYILDNYKRFYSVSLGDAKGEQKLRTEYDTITSFFNNRLSYASDSMKRALSLTGQLGTLNVNNETGGQITVNTAKIKKDQKQWTGKYFSDYEVTVKAEPDEGCRFYRWEVSGANLSESELTNPEISFVVNGSVTVTPIYEIGASSNNKGDCNNDGKVDIADAVLLQQYIIGKTNNVSNSDVDSDGTTDVFDLTALKRNIVK